MEKKLPRIERGTTKIYVPHENKEIAFDGCSEGPHNYQSVGRGLLERNLKVPIGDYTAHLVHAAYCIPEVENEPEFKEIKEIMRKRYLWVFNKDLWTSEGVYVVLDPKAVGIIQLLDENELKKMLKGGKELSWGGVRLSEDRTIRFAPKDSYKLGDHTSESLVKDGFMVASYDVEGAKNLGEVASKFDYNPKTYGLDIQEGQYSEQRASTLSGHIGGFNVHGDYHDGCGDGHAFGVQKTK